MDFHARFKSKGKKYRYLIYNSRQPSALLRNRAIHVPVGLDEQKMLSAAQFLLGKHDFTSFRASGSTVKTTERTIYSVSLKRSDDLIEFEIQGDGFLYNMVRIIVGTLIQIGSGKLEVSDMPHIIEAKDRRKAGLTAPAQGLYLIEVYY
jgi:tRNA pseudouridine38-40 synthase